MSGDKLKLLVDAGNSQVKYVLMGENRFCERGTIRQQQDVIPLLGRISTCWISNVGHSPLVEAIIVLLQENQIECQRIVSTAAFGDVTNAYAEPEKLGVDRWLAMLACRYWYKGNFAVIDYGTAVTCDFVDQTGKHHGGWISPGYHTMKKALGEHTELHVQDLDTDGMLAPGRNTLDAINLGCTANMYGLIQMAQLYWQQRHQEYKIFVCGGDTKRINFENFPYVEPAVDAVFYGMKHVISGTFAE